MGLLISEAYAYGTAEHKSMVDEACKMFLGDQIHVKVRDGVDMFTLGEITSLAGDYYADPGIFRTNAALARKFLNEHVAELESFKSISEFSSAVATNGTYLELATSNYSHFRLGSPTENAPLLCSKYHREARKYGDARKEQALVAEGFALHFLTDLFAAGHMRTPRFALTQHLQTSVTPNYSKDNAAIIGGLLAKAQHDRDNEKGLKCSFQSVADFISRQSTQPGEGIYFGDGSLQSVKSADLVRADPALLQLFQVIVWDIVTAIPSLAVMLESTADGKALLPHVKAWAALEAAELRDKATTGGVHQAFIEAVTPRPYDAPVNEESLFFVKNGSVYASRPVDDIVAKGLHLRCPAGRLENAWLEILHVDLNMTYVSVNPYIDVDVDAGIKFQPYSVKPYVSVRIDGGLGWDTKSANLIDKAIVIDGNSEDVVWLFNNVIFAAKAVKKGGSMKDAAVDGIKKAGDAVVDGMKKAGDAVVDGIKNAGDVAVDGLKSLGDLIIPPAY